MSRPLETGDLFFFYRNVVETEQAQSLDDVQNLYLVLVPDPGEESRNRAPARTMVVGRKRLPAPEADRSDPDSRGWVMTLEADSPEQLARRFSLIAYETETKGRRREAEAMPVGAARYALQVEDDQSYLLYRLHRPSELGEAQEAMGIREEARYVISVRNPSVEVEGFPDESPDFPNELVEAFGDLRWKEVDDLRYLNHENAQFVLIGALPDEGIPEDAVEGSILSGHPDPFESMALDAESWPTEALEEGRFAEARYPVSPLEPEGDRSEGGRRGGQAALRSASAAGIARSLEGITFPADRRELVRHAEDNDALRSILAALEELPDRDFHDMASVQEGLTSEDSEFQCPHCDQTFGQRSRFESHLETSHPAQAPSAADIQAALAGISFPASREDLLSHAEGRADDATLEVVQALPDHRYRDAAEVTRALGEIRRHEKKPEHQPSRLGGEAALESTSAARIASLMEGISFPASQAEVRRHARKADASEEEMTILNEFRDRSYNDMADVTREFGRIQGD